MFQYLADNQGADLAFSRGGSRVDKTPGIFFSRSTKFNFRALLEHYKDTGKDFCAADKF